MIINILRQRIQNYIKELIKDEHGISNLAVEEPKNEEFGDLSTNASMVLAPVLKENPLEIAEKLKSELISKFDEVEDISIAEPGFINFNLKDDFIKKALQEIVREKEKYGFNNSGKGISIQLEYVSSNPTGNLHIGHGRWGALGDSLSNIYKACGYDVFREYYVNDYGTQAEKFSECAQCIYLRHFGINTPYPESGYPEDVVSDAVERLLEKYNDRFIIEKNGGKKVDGGSFRKEVIEIMVSQIRETLALMGVEYDRWFYESSLYENSNFEKVIEDLKERNLIYSKDGALWFRTSMFADDEDRVVIRKDGNPTYFASDILYLIDKVKRGYDILLYILGADHHGYVDRLRAIGRALGLADDKIVIIIGQLVKIVDRGETLKMSRRKGNLYNLRDLIEEVGKDAVRYFFSMNSFDTPMDFDVSLAKQKSNQNPVYYVQYAHARIESIIEKIKESGLENRDLNGFSVENFSFEKIDTSEMVFKNKCERKLAKTMILYPDVVYSACRSNAPYLVTQYLYRLASEFHYFYNNFRIINDIDGRVTIDTDRFVLIMLVRQVLQNALKLLNVSAPRKM
ncbi:MAG: arginine--tRNA ligase [Actinomycetota bacterium]|nr:arginine--tRNA ligase [Actinomycetota bacterium]